MIIKRWDGSAFVEEYPKTIATRVFDSGNTESIFDANNKVKPKYLPNIVFDGLYFVGSIGTATPTTAYNLLLNNVGSGDFIQDIYSATTAPTPRSPVGLYWVVAATQKMKASSITPVQRSLGGGASNLWYTYFFRTTEPDVDNNNDFTLEAGDWYVITAVSGGDGSTSALSIQYEIQIVNNTYENATDTLDGIVRLSSRNTYAGLTGNHVVTEAVLKTVIDQAGFAAGSHGHGSILTGGTITADVVTPANTDTILISDTSASGLVSRGITIGTSTTTFLTEAGTWATPAGTYAHPTQNAIDVNATDNGINVIDRVQVNTLGHVTAVSTRDLSNATTSAAGVMSAADKTKLDGIESGANAYVHPNHSGDVTSVGDGAQTIANNAVSNAKLADMDASTIKGRLTASTGDPQDLTAEQVRTLINVADGANNYVHPTYTYSTPTDDTQTTLSNIQLISTLAQTNGHVTGGTARKLVAGSNVTLTAASDGNITIASSFTDTTYSAKALGGLSLDGTQFQMVHPLFVQADAPSSPLTGTIWFDL
jgi:hypothetical protein